MRPVHLLPAAGLVFGLMAFSPFVRGDGQPGAKTPAKPAAAAPKGPPKVELPVTRVVLFTAGVGYVHREGDVTGDARLDLRFDEADVNDLIKSLVLTDKDGGKVRAVTYDNRMPAALTLKGFAVDVTENPTVGQLMHQVRGEKVEVTDKGGVVIVGQIVSVERQPSPPLLPDPGELLNLLTEDGLQTAELKQYKRIKFVRPELQAEFVKALELLAAARGDNKKAVSVVFSGAGKRRVGVGYVTEAPLWKPSYRLTVDEKGALRLQGWATVENTTDEDWTDVKVGLVAGRPMTFRMDLYDPLFVPRPTVEPDLFASLRPPMYQGGLTLGQNMAAGPVENPGMNNPFFGNQNFFGGIGGGVAGLGGTPVSPNAGMQGGSSAGPYSPWSPRQSMRELYGPRLSYSDYAERVREGTGNVTPEEAMRHHEDEVLSTVGDRRLGDRKLGDSFRYTVAEPITLPRQKSALLPITDEPVGGTRVSIFNRAVLDKHPLLGLKLVNKTKLHLAQGPVVVYDGETFAGDARLPDLQPGETRLVSYAVDLGTESVAQPEDAKTVREVASVDRGRLVVRTRRQWVTNYLFRNRNPDDRTVIVEHEITEGRRLTAPAKPAESTRSYHRFELAVKAGQVATLAVTEESDADAAFELATGNWGQVESYAVRKDTPPAVKAVLAKLVQLRDAAVATQKEIEAEQAALKEIGEDQDRMRKNIEKTPKESQTFARYLKKFDDQETEIEKRQARIKELRAELAKQEKAVKDYADSAKAE